MTLAPRATASCTAIRPTPPLAPWISTVSPVPTSVFVNRCHAVPPASSRPAACSKLSDGRLVPDVGGVGDDPLGVAAADVGGDHLVADGQRLRCIRRARAPPRRRRPRPPCPSGIGRLAGIVAHVAAVQLVVDGVGAGRAHVDEHLPLAGCGQLDVLYRKDFRAAVGLRRPLSLVMAGSLVRSTCRRSRPARVTSCGDSGSCLA